MFWKEFSLNGKFRLEKIFVVQISVHIFSPCGFSDAVLKQFLLHLDETLAFGKKFIIEDLDETHLFVASEMVLTLKEKVWELMDNNSFNVTQQDWMNQMPFEEWNSRFAELHSTSI